jgi:hypothetical protein
VPSAKHERDVDIQGTGPQTHHRYVHLGIAASARGSRGHLIHAVFEVKNTRQ